MALRFPDEMPQADGPDSTGFVVLLAEGDAAPRGWRIDGSRVGDAFELEAEHEWPERVVALVPAALAPVRSVPRGDMPMAQALAAARLDPPGGGDADAHVVAAPAADGETVLSAVVARHDMDGWLAALASHGIEAAALVPAALALPVPERGFVAGELAGQALARDRSTAFAGEGDLLAAMAGDAEIARIDEAALLARLPALWAQPPLNLRTGPYAPARVSYFRVADWAQLARMAAVLALLVFLVLAVETVRLNRAAAAAEDDALAAAREQFPAASDLASAQAQIDAELVRRGAGGASFADAVPAVFAAMQPRPSVRLRTLGYGPDGTLTIRAAAPDADDLNAMLIDLQRDGWRITVPPEVAPDASGATVADITVRAP